MKSVQRVGGIERAERSDAGGRGKPEERWWLVVWRVMGRGRSGGGRERMGVGEGIGISLDWTGVVGVLRRASV